MTPISTILLSVSKMPVGLQTSASWKLQISNYMGPIQALLSALLTMPGTFALRKALPEQMPLRSQLAACRGFTSNRVLAKQDINYPKE